MKIFLFLFQFTPHFQPESFSECNCIEQNTKKYSDDSLADGNYFDDVDDDDSDFFNKHLALDIPCFNNSVALKLSSLYVRSWKRYYQCSESFLYFICVLRL